ncbi:unnamed protein product [Orchesella dallaii]|uniref:Cytochrome P450 4c3 n=1 Tax=Orchesella dallaii TaxID=48710 RepID=A0ABP1QZY0_9HEXA
MGQIVTFLLALPIILVLLLKIVSYVTRRRKQILKSAECNGWDNIPKVSVIRFLSTTRVLSSILVEVSNLCKQMGPIFRVKFFTEECVFLIDPISAHKLLTSKEHGHYPKPEVLYGSLHEMLGNGVLTSQGDYWQAQRRILSKGFSYSALRRYCKTYNKCARQLVSDLENKFDDNNGIKYQQIGSMIHLCSIKIITEAVMGLDSSKDEVEAEVVLDSFNNLKDIAIQRFRKGLLLIWNPIWKLHPLSRENTRNLKNVDDIIKRLILRYRNIQENAQYFQEKTFTSPTHDNGDKEEDNMRFDCMLELMYKYGLNEKQIVDEVKTLIWAGYETTSAAMHFLLFMLALNKTHQEACRKEVDKFFDDPTYCQNGELSMEGLLDMKYLERCFLETLRMFPVVLIILRRLRSPLKIDETLEIPVGTSAALPLGFYHYMEEYFPNPKKFDPDRFLTEDILKRQSFTFMPFSAGPRICIGLKFAMLEAKTVVAHILREFEVHTQDKFEDIALIPAMVSYPERDYYFHLQKRNVNTA